MRFPSRIQRSHSVQLSSLYLNVLGTIGSAIANSGSARLANVLRYASTGLRCSTLYSSRHTKPVAIAVVVAIAGMMRPAISFAFSLSTSGTA